MSNNLPDHFISHMFNNAKAEPIWLGFRIELRRNCAYYSFPQKASSLHKEQLNTLISDVVDQTHIMKAPLQRNLLSLTSQERAFIHEHYLTKPITDDQLSGTSIIADMEGTTACIINNGDHIQLVALTNLVQFHANWNGILQLEKAIGKHIPYAFSPQLGYLTADIGRCGTGFSLLAYLHTPLILKEEDLKQQLFVEDLPDELLIQTQHDLDTCHIIQITNKYAIGISEDNIINTLMTYCAKIKGEEEKLRTHAKTQEIDALHDLFGRAYGLLRHSHKLELNETRTALSAIKLGLHLGFIEGITDEQINTLLFILRRAHLSLNHKGVEDISKARAEYLQQSIQSIQLNF